MKDGGPAFPITYEHQLAAEWKGMSLRDYFAAAALQGLLADPAIGDAGPSPQAECARLAQCCYLMADAMLAERAK